MFLIPKPLTPIATNSGTICEGGSVNLFSSNVPGASSYSWWGNASNFTSGKQNPTFSNMFTKAGTYQFYVTAYANGCASAEGMTEVVITKEPEEPEITANNSSICAGSTLSLNAVSTSPGVSYSWTGPNNFTSDLQNPQINNIQPASSGNYYAVAKSGSCASTDASVYISVGGASAAPVITYDNGFMALKSSIDFGNIWYKNGVLLPNETSKYIFQPTAGKYTVEQNSGDCTTASAPYYYLISGINTQTDNLGFEIFPNPNNGQFHVSLNETGTADYILEISNTLGQTVYHNSFNNRVSANSIDFNNYTKGIYFIKLNQNNITTIKKILVQ